MECFNQIANEYSILPQELYNFLEDKNEKQSVYPEKPIVKISGEKIYIENLKVMEAHKLYTSGGKIISLTDSLSKSLNIKDPPIDWFASEKFDGIRAVWDGKQFVSRGSGAGLPKVYSYVPDFFIECMPNGIALDGEIFIGRNKFSETGKLSNLKPGGKYTKKQIDNMWKNVKYNVFDVLSSKGNFESRQAFLKRIVEVQNEKYPNCALNLTEQIKIESIEQLINLYTKLTSEGAEGIMLRAPGSPYEQKRSKYLLKYKIKEDSEALVLEHIEGTGRLKGLLGALKCELLQDNKKTGIIFNIGTGFTDLQRETAKDDIPIDSIVSFSYMELSKDLIPRHPVYRGIREDYYLEKKEEKKIIDPDEIKNTLIESFDILIKTTEASREQNWQFQRKKYQETLAIFKITSSNNLTNITDILKILRESGMKLPEEEAYFLKNNEYKSSLLNKINEILTKGNLSTINEYSQNPKVKAITELTRIPEIGPSAAEKLYNQGITTIEELSAVYSKDPKILNNKQAIGLKYYSDLEKRIPRTEMNKWNEYFIKTLNKTIESINKKIDEKLQLEDIKMEIVGSYRREAVDSGDIDLLISSNKMGKEIMNKFQKKILSGKYLSKDLVFSAGDTKMMALGKIDEYFRHIDIFYYSEKEYPFALLFSTGNAQFNVDLRNYAIKKGYSLSDKGLKRGSNKGPEVPFTEYENKIQKEYPLTEEDIFKFLDLEYIKPKDRKGQMELTK